MSGLFFKSITFFYVAINPVVIFVVAGQTIPHPQDARYFALVERAGACLAGARQRFPKNVNFGVGSKNGFVLDDI